MIIAQSAAFGLAFILDLIFGDPDFLIHPIRLMGKLISLTEKLTRRVFPKNDKGEIAAGVCTVIFVILVCGGIAFILLFFAYKFNIVLGAAVETVICYFMLAMRSLGKAGNSVYTPLIQGDTEEARKKVSMIVGRDTEMLDDIGITKAAVETVAENASDGVIAPLLYMALGGGTLGCVYKAINTMDSMIGYRNEKYIHFGKCAAKLDDIANYVPSRISAFLMIIASYILDFDAVNAARIHKRDSRKHASPNSAQTESVVAGALNIQLAGDAQYFGRLYKKPFIGDAVRDIQFSDIKRTNAIMYLASVLSLVICAAMRAAMYALIMKTAG